MGGEHKNVSRLNAPQPQQVSDSGHTPRGERQEIVVDLPREVLISVTGSDNVTTQGVVRDRLCML